MSRGTREHLTGCPRHEALSPKLNPFAGQLLMADPVGGGHVTTIGDGMGPLNGFPGIVLLFSVTGLFRGMPSYGSRIKQNFGALQRGESGRFRVPLVPADQYTNPSIARLPGPESKIARSEIEFLIEQRIVRYVHLAIKPQQTPVGVD